MSEASTPLLRQMPLALLAAELRAMDEASLREFVGALLTRAEAVEPMLRALLPEDGREARLHREIGDIVQRWPDPSTRPALFGVPVGVKDIIAVDGLPTRAGSALPPEAFEMPEATVVARLREAGALVFGKTVTAEFAAMGPGATTNPHNPRHTPGGSSSGSAASVATGYFPLALGTQTGGSVTRPAAFCGVVGFKPSYGRIPIAGVLPHAISVDTLGLFTQDVAGVALAAPAVIEDWRIPPKRDVASLTLAVPDGPYLELASSEGRQAFEELVTRLARSNVDVMRVSFLEDAEEVLERHARLMDAEFAAEHEERFARWGSLYTGVGAGGVDRGREVSPEDRAAGLAGREELRTRFMAAIDEIGADAFICPSAPGPAPSGLRSTGDSKMNAPWTHAGVPTVSLPAGAVDGLPVGLQLVGRFGADEELIGIAAALERLVAPD